MFDTYSFIDAYRTVIFRRFLDQFALLLIESVYFHYDLIQIMLKLKSACQICICQIPLSFPFPNDIDKQLLHCNINIK